MFDTLRARGDRPSYRFWLLAAFLLLIFILGGSSRSDIAALMIIRPVSALVLTAGLYTLTATHIAAYRFTVLATASVVGLIILHLVPLPPLLWHLLPGRGLMIEIDAAMGNAGSWRPLSMVPSGTWNALFAMLPPLAVLVLAVQLDATEHRRLLPLVIGVAVISGFIGLLQVIGQGIGSLYPAPADAPEVATGLFANPNHQAAFLVCAIPLIATFAGSDVKKAETVRSRRIAALIGIFAMIPLIAITGSRAGIVLTGMAMLSLVFTWRTASSAQAARRRAPPRVNPRVIQGAGIAFAALLVAFMLYKADVASRLANQDPLADFRFQIWRPIVAMVGTYMPFGSGIGSFVEVYQVSEPLDLLRAQYVNHAHNDLLEIAMTGGIPALALLAAAVVAWGRRAFAVLAGQPDTNDDRQSVRLDRLGAIMVAVLALASLTDYPLRTPSLSCLLVLAAIWMGTTCPSAPRSRASA